MLRFGLCCIFVREPVRFRSTTARHLSVLDRPAQLARLSRICRENSESLQAALKACVRLRIGAFRVLSPLFPRSTHPEVGYRLDDLPEREAIADLLAGAAEFRRLHDLRLSFHPDQFVVLSSPDQGVTARSLAELEYQGELSERLGAEAITLHGGGIHNSKEESLVRLRAHVGRLSPRVRCRLALENDDRRYTVRDLLPLCRDLSIPLVYDVHHHRCHPDGLSVEEATVLAAATWGPKEPWLHLSSPRDGWSAADPRAHADYIDPADFPAEWRQLRATVDVEAKAKELAVVKLMADLGVTDEKSPGRSPG